MDYTAVFVCVGCFSSTYRDRVHPLDVFSKLHSGSNEDVLRS